MQQLQAPPHCLSWTAVETLATLQVLRAAWHVVQHVLHAEASFCPLLSLQQGQRQPEQQKQLAPSHSNSSVGGPAAAGWKLQRFPQICRCWRCCWCSRAGRLYPKLHPRLQGMYFAAPAAALDAETPGNKPTGDFSSDTSSDCAMRSRKSSCVHNSSRESSGVCSGAVRTGEWAPKGSSSTRQENGRIVANHVTGASSSRVPGESSSGTCSNACSNSSTGSRSGPLVSTLFELAACQCGLHVVGRPDVKKDFDANVSLRSRESSQQQSSEQTQPNDEGKHCVTVGDRFATNTGESSSTTSSEGRLRGITVNAAGEEAIEKESTGARDVTSVRGRGTSGRVLPEVLPFAEAGGRSLGRDAAAAAAATGRRRYCDNEEARKDECREMCYCNRFGGDNSLGVHCSDELLLTVCSSRDLDVLLCDGESRVAAAWGLPATGAGKSGGNTTDGEEPFVSAAAQHVEVIVQELKNRDLLGTCLPQHANFF